MVAEPHSQLSNSHLNDLRLDEWPGITSLCTDADRLPLSDHGRIRSGTAAFRQLWRLRHRLGISRITDITELDRLGIPVVACIRPLVNVEQITTTQGKGIRFIDAAVSAVMEAVERHSAASYKETTLATIQHFETVRVPYLGPKALMKAWSDISPIEWVSAVDLKTGGEIFVPAAEALFPYYAPRGTTRPVRPSTTGLSSGSTIAEAILNGLFEVIERDAVSKFIAGRPGKLLDLNSANVEPESTLIERFNRAGVQLIVIDLSDFAVSPTFRAVSLDSSPAGPRLLIFGQATNVSAPIALRRALLENIQSRAVSVQGSREDLIRNAPYRNTGFEELQMLFELIRTQTSRAGVTKLENKVPENASVQYMLQNECEKLQAAGYSTVVYTDLTNADIGIPTVHVSVPRMIDSVVDSTRGFAC
jgi:thioglycine synthase